MENNKKIILVTGAAGFIGSHLVEKLIQDDNSVICVDDLSTGYKDFLPKDNRISFINEKIQDIDIDKLPKSINGIFHLAAQASVQVSIDEFYSSSSNNLLSSIRIFDWAKMFNVPIVYASSSAVYGNLPLGDDETEKYDILSPYAQDKLTLEHYAKMCWNVYKTPSIGFRFFNVYGPRQDPSNPYSGVISIFIDRLMQNKPVIVNGGHQTRDFVFVKDIVDVMIKSMDSFLDNRFCEVLNIGTGTSVTIENLLSILSGILKVQPEVIVKELPSGDPERSVGTYKKLKNVLNIDVNQFVKLEEGLKSTIKFVESNKNR